MTRFLVLPLAVFVLFALAAQQPSSANAQDGGVDFETSVDNGYPTELTFNLRATAGSEITDVTLRYSIIGQNASGIGKPDEYEPSDDIDVAVDVEVNQGNNFIPVSSQFRYSWDIATADGDVVTTPEETYLYMPPDRDWQSVEDEIMRVYYHGQRESTAQDFLEAGQETYQRMAVELFQVELPVTPVNVVLFATESEMDPARVGRGGSFDAAVTTCGTKFNINTVFVIPVSCGTSDITDTLRHEFAHIINEAAGEGPFGQIPSWLDEGTAVYAQTEPGEGFRGAFESAVRSDNLVPFNQMASPSNDPSGVNRFYGQSWAMATFLIERAGPGEYSRFFNTIKEGARFDQALEEVYGFDLAGFEDAFREEHGLEPRSSPDPAEPPAQEEDPERPDSTPAGDPTRPPLATTGGGDDGPFDTGVILIVGSAAMFGLLGLLFYLISMMLSSNRSAAATGPGTASGSGSEDETDSAWRTPPPPPPSDRGDRLIWREDDDTDPDERS